MKKSIYVILIILFSFVSCSLFKDNIKISDVIKEKERLDKSENPARKFVIKQELSDKSISINDILVKEVTSSTNIDYDFCIIADIPTEKGMIECYIYTKNVNKIAKLEKGKSKIDVEGEFGRFFTMLDEYYTKIEIIKATIRLK